MDILYILGKGSPRNDLELLFSLRSVKKYMGDLGRVFICGERPLWLKNVVHIPCTDPYDKHWQNAHNKIKKACENEALSEEFLLMNDDFFMLKPFTGKDYPYYGRKDRDGGCNGPYNFQTHSPMRITKGLYKQMPLDITQKGEWSPRSLYGNYFVGAPVQVDDFNINVNAPKLTINEQICHKPLISTGHDAILNDEFCVLLESYFPEPSEFEDQEILGTPLMKLF